MKGTPRPTWTPQRHAWLRELAKGNRNPSGTEHAKAAYSTRCLGWTDWLRGPGNAVRGVEYLTLEGHKVLARWNAGYANVAPKPKPPATTELLQLEPAELATRLLDMGAEHARAVYEALHVALFGFVPPVGPHYHHGGPVGKLPPEHVPSIVEPGQTVPAHHRPCPVKLYEPDVGLRPGAPTECDGNVPADCALVKEIDAQTVHAPQVGIRAPFSAHLGQRVTPKGFSECLRCRGKGVVGHNFTCPACHGACTIRRTVEL